MDAGWSNETYVKVAGKWRYVDRAVDQHGQVIDVYVSPKRDIPAARKFFTGALNAHGEPDEIITDLAQALETTIEQLIPDAFHNTEQTPRTHMPTTFSDRSSERGLQNRSECRREHQTTAQRRTLILWTACPRWRPTQVTYPIGSLGQVDTSFLQPR